MRPSFTFSFLAAFAFALACGAADAQGWLDVLKDNAAQEAVEHGSEALQSSADGRFLIEGHTDSTGDAAHNIDLSKRRAEAVKSVLVAQFGIDGARLSTAGLGATKPVASNDTPAGRAENRRVEFVRQ
jgi:outer membrane protein OmpA-like peptidoglycan-associated protein